MRSEAMVTLFTSDITWNLQLFEESTDRILLVRGNDDSVNKIFKNVVFYCWSESCCDFFREIGEIAVISNLN